MATRAQQIELLATGVLYNGAVIANPYAKFLVAGTTTAKTAWDDADKSVAITKKALDAQGRAVVYGDGIYKIQIYSGDPDASGVLLFTVDHYKVTAVAGNTRTITAANVAGSVDDSLVEADTTSNSITYTLPDAALMAGKIIQIAKSVAANTLTIAAASGQLVNGAASVAYTAQYSTGVFQSNGSNWYVFQTVGDAETLGGLASTDFQLVADMTSAATASKGVVRDANGRTKFAAASASDDVVIKSQLDAKTASITTAISAIDTADISTLRSVASVTVNVTAGAVVLLQMNGLLSKGGVAGTTFAYIQKSGGTATIHANYTGRSLVLWRDVVDASGGAASFAMSGAVIAETTGTLIFTMYAQSDGSTSTNSGCFISASVIR